MHAATIETIHDFVKNKKDWEFFKLQEDYSALQRGYRLRQQQGYHNQQQVQSYVFSRLPATYAVAFEILRQYFANATIQSVIDWGCGVGAASLALADIVSNSINYHLIESNPYALHMSKEFMHLLHGDKHLINHEMPITNVDLAIMSYSLNELGDNWQSVVKTLWQKSENLLIIEPGTHSIFQNLAKVRHLLISNGAKVIAPCYHAKKCPLENTNDWCHFQKRIARTKEMRFLKKAERGFEDEAYSYVLFSKTNPISESNSRIIAKPNQHGGHINLKLCNSNGLVENVTVSKSSTAYKSTKKLQWGDCF
jgi:ribosomal protein RSM22 (predicted rRNA methylase)